MYHAEHTAADQVARPYLSTRRSQNRSRPSPRTLPARRGAIRGELHTQKFEPRVRRAHYLAASCAHFANVVKNGFAAAGGSTSPVSAALNVTM